MRANQLLVKLTEFSLQIVNVLTCLKRKQGPSKAFGLFLSYCGNEELL